MTYHSELHDPRMIKALAHPMRARILVALERGKASPRQLAAELDVPLGNLSYHVRQLAAFGLVRLVATTQKRGAIEHHYELTARPDITDDQWAALPGIVKHAVIGAALEPIGELVAGAAASGGFSRSDAHLSRTALTLDAEGWQAASAELVGMLERLDAIEQASHQRLTTCDHDGATSSTVVMMHFEPAPAPVETTQSTHSAIAGDHDRRPAHDHAPR